MSNANYMDGVPVKIAEKFKPLLSMYNLSQPLLNKTSLENDFYWNCPSFLYDFQLEKQALSKIEQWKLIRRRNKEQRIERILKRERQRQQELEDRQKNLLNNVSYPSTDDLYSSEEEEGHFEQYTKNKENDVPASNLKSTSPQNCFQHSVNSFHNILQPTVLSFNSSLNEYHSNTSMATTNENQISNSFNYKDFEEDTSSPFDNIELKTINDLDVLAQVLHNSQIKSPADKMLNDCDLKELNDIVKTSPICLPEQGKITTENIPKCNTNLPRFNNDLNLAEGGAQLCDQSFTNSTLNSCHILKGSKISNGEFNNQSNQCNANEIESVTYQLNKYHLDLFDDQIKSKSVPDILKELRDEVKLSEIRRHRNCSFNNKEDSSINKDGSNDNASVDVFSQLDNNAKELARRISAMGFPLKRVARIVQVFGADDKKVVEHLIPLSELADLGFEESKISEALLRNENNKNKALDDLIT